MSRRSSVLLCFLCALVVQGSVEPQSFRRILAEHHPQWLKNIVHKLKTRKVEGPPVIDVHGTMSGAPSKEEIEAIGKACREYGFFSIVNHGIPETTLRKFDDAMRLFFALPNEVKLEFARTNDNSRGYANNEFTKQTRDMKEIYDYGHTPAPHLPANATENRVLDGFNQIPPEDLVPGFAEALAEYYMACTQVSFRLIRTIALSLGLPAKTFDPFFGDQHTSFLRLNKYPPINNKDAEPFLSNEANLDEISTAQDDFDTPLDKLQGKRLGVNRHFDAGALTLLRQDPNISALQMNLNVHRPGQKPHWIDVAPIPGALTVNVGDMLQVLSNDLIKAPEHRVKAATHEANVRFSAPFFLNPAYEATIQPILPENATTTAKYQPFTWGFFRRRRFEGDFQNEGVPEIQIAQFSI